MQITNAHIERPMHPTEGVPFEVNPLDIDRNLFQKKRTDRRQEKARKLILKAFAKMDKNPERYSKSFNTLMPEKNWDRWDRKTAGELKKLAANLGDHMADWVEQALEWAQRIANGEPWEDVCNKPDTANWYRLITWKNGYYWLVGGSRKNCNSYSASDVNNISYHSDFEIYYTVPLVVL